MPENNFKQEIGDKERGFVHHAYLLVGSREESARLLEVHLKSEMKVEISGNADVWTKDTESFTVDDSRIIQELQVRRATEADGYRLFILSADFFTREAQNALLKVLEDPSPHSRFFILTPFPESLLPTLLSRLARVNVTSSSAEDTSVAKKFIQASIPERLEIIKKIIDDKDKASAFAFLDSLESVFAESPSRSTQDADFLRDLWKSRDYLRDTSSSVKLILEHVALTAPNNK